MKAIPGFKYIPWVIIILILIPVGFFVFHHGHRWKEKCHRMDVPAAVFSAFEHAYPNASVERVEKEEGQCMTCYEIESEDGKTERNILYTAEGKVCEIKEDINTDALPSAIQTTLTKEYSKAKVEKLEKVTRDSTVQYELHLKVGKMTTELIFDAMGKVVQNNGEENEKQCEEKGEEGEND